VNTGTQSGRTATPDLDDLSDAWRAASREAGEAYRAWGRASPTERTLRYAVFLAAADREEAAERALLGCSDVTPMRRRPPHPSRAGRQGSRRPPPPQSTRPAQRELVIENLLRGPEPPDRQNGVMTDIPAAPACTQLEGASDALVADR